MVDIILVLCYNYSKLNYNIFELQEGEFMKNSVFGIVQDKSDEVKSRMAYDDAVKSISVDRNAILFSILSDEFKEYKDYFLNKKNNNLQKTFDSIMNELKVELPKFIQTTGGFNTEVVVDGEKQFIKGGYKYYPEAETRSKLVEPLLKTFFNIGFSEEVKSFGGGRFDYLLSGDANSIVIEVKKLGYGQNLDAFSYSDFEKIIKSDKGNKLVAGKGYDRIRTQLYGQVGRYIHDNKRKDTGSSLALITNGVYYVLCYLEDADRFTDIEFEKISSKYPYLDSYDKRTGFFDNCNLPFAVLSIYDDNFLENIVYLMSFIASYINGRDSYNSVRKELHHEYYKRLGV